MSQEDRLIFRLYLVAAAVLVVFFLYLSSLNHETVTIRLSGGSSFETPLIPIIFIAFLGGYLLSYLAGLLKQAGNYLEHLKSSKRNKTIETSAALLDRAKRAILLNNWEKGEELLKRCISTPFINPEPYVLLLGRYIEKGDLGSAFSILDSIPAEYRNNLEILLYKAKALIAKRSTERACDVLEMISETDNSIETRRFLRNAYIDLSMWEKASEFQNEIIREANNADAEIESEYSVRIGYQIAKNMMKKGHDEEAVKKLNELIKKWPDFSQPHISLGKLHWKKGNKELASKVWEKGYNRTKNMIFLFILEDYHLKDEDPQGIIEAYKNYINREPGNPLLHLFIGKLYLRLEMLDEAIESFKKTEELELSSSFLYRLIGESQFRKGFYKQAADNFKDALKIKRKILVPFVCKSCKGETDEWEALCPHCRSWETLEVALESESV